MKIFNSILILFKVKPKSSFLLIALLTLASGFEAAGIGFLIPMLETIGANESNQPTSGQSLITLKFSADYVVNNRVNLKLFYDQVVTDYVVSSSFPTSNTNVGVSLRFTLM